MFDSHMEDGSVSSSGFELRYPALKPYDYGVDSDENGMSIVVSITALKLFAYPSQTDSPFTKAP